MRHEKSIEIEAHLSGRAVQCASNLLPLIVGDRHGELVIAGGTRYGEHEIAGVIHSQRVGG